MEQNPERGWEEYVPEIKYGTSGAIGTSGLAGSSGHMGVTGLHRNPWPYESSTKPKPLTEKEFMKKYKERQPWSKRFLSYFKSVKV